MIVRMHPAGRSFRWLSTYLDHDTGKAQTSERVSFVHTLNLAHDDVKSAVDSMLHTYRARHLLKAEAGIRRGGRDVEKPVKHVSLSWHEAERPTQAQMIDAVRSYLRAVGADEHEVVVWGHTDKKHPHVHLMINLIHPERGTALDTRFERREAQKWALAFEREYGKIHCEERLKPIAERQPSPPRNVWEELRKLAPEPRPDRERTAAIDYDLPAHLWRRQEWTALRERQKDERISFFEDLVGHYRVYRQQLYNTTGVSFRQEWANYYTMLRSGMAADTLKVVKDDLVARQKEQYRLAVREAAPALREERNRAYQALLAGQKAERAQLVANQEVGLPSPHLGSNAPAFGVTAPASSDDPLSKTRRVPEPDLTWTERGGMAAQQRSANRWVDQIRERLSRQETVMPMSALERLRRRLERGPVPDAGKAIEKDGLELER